MKKAVTILFIFMLCVIPCVMTARGQGDVELPGESVYASPEKQKEIAELFDENDLNYLKNRQIWILTESITPVYYVDIWEYAETREWKMYPTGYDKGKYFADKTAEETSVYRAKTTDYDGVFAGDITILCLDGEIEIIEFVHIEWGNNVSLVSFADHINNVDNGINVAPFGAEPSDNKLMPYTRYVLLGEYGSAFYVNKEIEGFNQTYKFEYLYVLNSVSWIFEQFGKNGVLEFNTPMDNVVEYLKGQKNNSDFLNKILELDCRALYSNTYNVVNISEYLQTDVHHFYTERDKMIGYEEPTDEKEDQQNDSQSETVGSSETSNLSEETKNETPTVIYSVIAVVLVCAVVGGVVFGCKKR